MVALTNFFVICAASRLWVALAFFVVTRLLYSNAGRVGGEGAGGRTQNDGQGAPIKKILSKFELRGNINLCPQLEDFTESQKSSCPPQKIYSLEVRTPREHKFVSPTGRLHRVLEKLLPAPQKIYSLEVRTPREYKFVFPT